MTTVKRITGEIEQHDQLNRALVTGHSIAYEAIGAIIQTTNNTRRVIGNGPPRHAHLSRQIGDMKKAGSTAFSNGVVDPVTGKELCVSEEGLMELIAAHFQWLYNGGANND